ncbi:type 1 glutamine amidotransferase [Oceanospirillum beijerinckii]|uniref:type 1 glutamine amidotransferase n=1 Tax=Oceanospirillum beijerinckii TaxID=64976 RepID=UPI000407BE21|nr:type 1 glutamine amidotransferase [Oceanospirillum beijerinckii]
MKLGILATDIGPEMLVDQHGSFADMFVNLFNRTDKGFSYQIYPVLDNIFPGSLDECDGWVITGSVAGVYDNLPWMEPLKQLIVEIYEQKRPMVGICFGHQIVADALGGKVEKFSGGWSLGVQDYQIEGVHDFIPGGIGSFAINAIHQDQVIEKPDASERLAYSSFCSNAGLVYGEHIVTLQGHPEFTQSYERDLLNAKLETAFPLDLKQAALETVESKKLDSPDVAVWLADFLENAFKAYKEHQQTIEA